MPALLLLALAGAAEGRPSDAELGRLLDRLREQVGAPGAILGVAAGAGPVHLVASGVADRESGARLGADSPYFLGSIAKTYTAVTVLRLAEEGRLSLDDPLGRFLPSFPDGDRIRIRHLLAHTSGIKDFYKYLYYRPDREEMIALVTKSWSQEELLALGARFGRWFEPGTDWDYSNANYFLLGVVVERAGGVALTEAYRRAIYAPLGLRRTWVAWHEDSRGPLPTGYLGPVASWKHSEMFGALGATTRLDRSPVEWGAGGVAAPAEEAIAFLRGLFGGKLLAPASLAAMTEFRDTPALGVFEAGPKSGTPDGYGLGLARMQRAGFTVIGHGGLFTGHTAGLWRLPECDLTVAVYFNRGFVDQRAVLDALLPVLTGEREGGPCLPASGGARSPESPPGR